MKPLNFEDVDYRQIENYIDELNEHFKPFKTELTVLTPENIFPIVEKEIDEMWKQEGINWNY